MRFRDNEEVRVYTKPLTVSTRNLYFNRLVNPVVNSVIQFSIVKMGISNGVLQPLVTELSSALRSTMFMNGVVESILVLMRIIARSR